MERLLIFGCLVALGTCRHTSGVGDTELVLTEEYPKCPDAPIRVVSIRQSDGKKWVGFWELNDGGIELCQGTFPPQMGDFPMRKP